MKSNALRHMFSVFLFFQICLAQTSVEIAERPTEMLVSQTLHLNSLPSTQTQQLLKDCRQIEPKRAFGTLSPNPEIEIHDSSPSSSYLQASHKIIAKPSGATHILCKACNCGQGTDPKHPVLGFEDMDHAAVSTLIVGDADKVFTCMCATKTLCGQMTLPIHNPKSRNRNS
jgi:hypothetical protein